MKRRARIRSDLGSGPIRSRRARRHGSGQWFAIMTAIRPAVAATATSEATSGLTATLPRTPPKESSVGARAITASTTTPLSINTSRAALPALAPAGSSSSIHHHSPGIEEADPTDDWRMGSPLLMSVAATSPGLAVLRSPAGPRRLVVLCPSRVSPLAMDSVANRYSTVGLGRNSTHNAPAAIRAARNQRIQGGDWSQSTFRRYETRLWSGRGSLPLGLRFGRPGRALLFFALGLGRLLLLRIRIASVGGRRRGGGGS